MSTNPKLCAIVAMDRNRVIGRDGDLPWRLPSDLKHFKRVTLGKPCLMGRKTWESLPFPLPGRPNLVLTRDQDYDAPKAQIFTDMREMIGCGFELAGASGVDEVMLIGGAQLYGSLLQYCDRLYVTHVDAEVTGGDAYFPSIDAKIWETVSTEGPIQAQNDDHAFTVAIYDRRPKPLSHT